MIKNAFLCILIFALCGTSEAANPLWWTERGVLDASATSDFSPVNEGQLRWVTLQAFREVDAHAPRGNSAAAASLVNGWLASPLAGQDFALSNIGQGKNLASLLYSGLATSGLSIALPLTADPASDFSPLVIGQTKSLFNFNVFGAPADPTQDPVITEIVTQGSTYPSSSNNADWVEIYNPTSATINLHNYYLTADGGGFNDETGAYEQAIWQFPVGATLAPSAYRIVLFGGSGGAGGSDLQSTLGDLKGSGQYLALLKGSQQTVVQQFFPRLPKMSGGFSFGLTADFKQTTFFATTTPDAANGTPLATSVLLAPPVIISSRGMQTQSFALMIQKPTATSKVYYRFGGDAPTKNDSLYDVNNPPLIDKTCVVRAYATDGTGTKAKESEVATSTFIFPTQVLTQTRPTINLSSPLYPYPQTYPVNLPGTSSTITVDYGMNASIASFWTPQLVTALSAIPAISIVLPYNSLFDTAGTAKALFEQPPGGGKMPNIDASFEWLDPRGGKPSMQRDMSVAVTGDSSIYWEVIKKKSFKVRFNKNSLDDGVRFDFFDKGAADFVSALAIKNPAHDSWPLNPDWDLADHASYIADQMVSRTYQAMSQPGATNLQPDNRAVHVFINGLYWGIYFLNERPDEAYLAKRKGGYARKYQTFDDYTPPNVDDPANINVDGYDDYVLACAFLAVGDWPGNNIRIGGLADTPNQWEFFTWGLEFQTLRPEAENLYIVNYVWDVMQAYGKALPGSDFDAAFQQKFVTHLQQRCGPGGALSASVLHARLQSIYNDFAPVAIAESARWGGGYDGTESYGPADILTEKGRMDNVIDTFPYRLFNAYANALGISLINPYPAPSP